ncbi:MAG: Glutamine amidotransferase subunit PdxT [Methanosaeta sp. PtaB.Bin018]|nr:MAG: Glutamine amidotransferase subunit PdxT [Methanosaeta sp. PtaB.Bin018]OPY44764.1 MAG: Glutamine amidotransferase subunit PdxT [Methanosaeta sp. PtaU1.Bin016]
MTRIGVLALQGDVSEHVLAMQRALSGKGEVLEIRRPGEILGCDGLVLPGGESTSISRQLEISGMAQELKAAARSGVPILATCAGLVLVSREIEGDAKVRPLGLMDIKVDRNAFGPQRESFEADLQVEGFERPYRAVFIRAPAIVDVGNKVQVLARIGEVIVGARQDNLLALAFHPELTEDMRFHQIFQKMLEA